MWTTSSSDHLSRLCVISPKIMHDEFEMSMIGELNFFLGLQIKQLEDGIFFNQSKYVKEMLKKFGLEDAKPIKTPISSKTKLTRDEEGEPINDTKYRGMIGSLLYLTASRPDIMFSSTPPLLTSPTTAPTHPIQDHLDGVTLNLDPIELLFSTLPSSPSFLDLLGDLPPSTMNPSS
ncbi:retrovirus-related pol polyprotein from transposon TNT 1-94 [Tanacetum coccineum]|uniref:Retrovirus-related pol polyprotein from transposon TNT 1-94 n=1 Tax=Tanacetum coccineum TaxID=301880 RepID=A0ABQ4YTM6_9ASTR